MYNLYFIIRILLLVEVYFESSNSLVQLLNLRDVDSRILNYSKLELIEKAIKKFYKLKVGNFHLNDRTHQYICTQDSVFANKFQCNLKGRSPTTCAW